MRFVTYILLCDDNSFYVGHTHDLTARVVLHTQGRGAFHTASRGSPHLVYSEEHATESAAMARERQLKKWSRAKKAALIRGDFTRLHELSRSHGTSLANDT
jgi:predicted GIY-YIG superfamily endonuclease